MMVALFMPADITLSKNQDAVKKRIAYSIVREEKSKEVIVKMVNLLPVTVNTSFELSGIITNEKQAMKVIM